MITGWIQIARAAAAGAVTSGRPGAGAERRARTPAEHAGPAHPQRAGIILIRR